MGSVGSGYLQKGWSRWGNSSGWSLFIPGAAVSRVALWMFEYVLREETTEENIERALQGAIDQIPLCQASSRFVRTSDRCQSIPVSARTYFRSALRQFATCVSLPKPYGDGRSLFRTRRRADIKDEGIGFDSLTKLVKDLRSLCSHLLPISSTSQS